MKMFALFGKKDARIAALACGDAHHTLQALRDNDVSRFAVFFSTSLISALESFGRHVFCHSKTPEFNGIGEHPDPEIITRFAQYAAWYFHQRYISENATLLARASGHDDCALRGLLADCESAREALFPITDHFVIEAVTQTLQTPGILDQKHSVGVYRFTAERFRLFVAALGLSNFDHGDTAARKYQADELGIMEDAEIFAMAQALSAFSAAPVVAVTR